MNLTMSMSTVLPTLAILTVFVCVVLAAFLLTVKSERQLANRLLAVFLLLTVVDLSGWLWGVQTSWLAKLRILLSFLQMPFFLGFITASCFGGFRQRWWHAMHAVPFVLAVILALAPGGWPTLTPVPLWVVVALHVQYYLYMAMAVRLLYRFRLIFRQYYADARSQTLIWLSQLVVVSLIAHTLVVMKSVAGFSGATSSFQWLQITVALIALTTFTWFTFKALLQPEIFRNVDRTLQRVSRLLDNTAAPPATDDPKMQRLLEYMEQQQPFLDAGLTLPQLARQLDMPARELSLLINHRLGVHFFDFVNRYRVALAREMLRDDQQRSILDILYAVGFNSKSSFNAAFRKYTGDTPSRYRQDHATTAG
ncbi:MAG: hypothetical protein Tsb002_14810 [Wenzhouxiangellaceae bacterium]